MKHLIPFIIFALSGSAYAFYVAETPAGLTLQTPDNNIYHFENEGDRLKTYGVDGTCYWYNGEAFSDCTQEEKTSSLAQLVTPQKPYTISNTSDTIYLTTNLKVVINGKEVQ